MVERPDPAEPVGPLRLVHYFDARRGPFRSLSALPPDDARRVTRELAAREPGMLGERSEAYVDRRRELERLARAAFVAQGGTPRAPFPQYMVVEPCAWLAGWYARPAAVECGSDAFEPGVLSFTYGDLFPTFSPHVRDGREYRGRVYTLDGIRELLGRIGTPQRWNADGRHGPERYVEVQVWQDAATVLSRTRPLVPGPGTPSGTAT